MRGPARNVLRHAVALLTVALLITAMHKLADVREPAPWTEPEIALLESLWIGSLPPPPPDHSNAVADDPLAAQLGERLFFDPRMSADGRISCASCHQPERHFTDGLPKGRGIGESNRNTQSIVAAAYSPWLYWDGRRDSLWAQALTPLEDPAEHGWNRMALARLLASDTDYRARYEQIFGALPDLTDGARYPPAASPLSADAAVRRAWDSMSSEDQHAVNKVFANAGKAIAAFERRVQPERTRFDDYVEAVLAQDAQAAASVFNQREVRGLRLFIGRGECIQCHNGPLLSNQEFHNTGVLSAPGDLPDHGRAAGLRQVRANPFNCLGRYSDDPQRRCQELQFARSGPDILGAMRTPSLRNLQGTAPFMHKGQIGDLAAVLEHYNRAPLAMIGHNEAEPLGLGQRDLAELEAFLQTLAAPAVIRR